jgi:hypothetical protein
MRVGLLRLAMAIRLPCAGIAEQLCVEAYSSEYTA